ncbi:MAG: biotin/lipoyl-binding protein [Clostridiales bacterium]|nr:biotin/lipoyl-binding protein [Clostridiales bacterium]MCF8023280.1 biotin/lipoyl-binding protein [Clostridiales bacterium]
MKKFKVKVNEEIYEVEIEEVSGDYPPAQKTAVQKPVESQVSRPRPVKNVQESAKPDSSNEEGKVISPMPGSVNQVMVEPGDNVKKGSVLLILEAMKMQNEVIAPIAGTIQEIYIEKGQTVNRGDILLFINK